MASVIFFLQLRTKSMDTFIAGAYCSLHFEGLSLDILYDWSSTTSVAVTWRSNVHFLCKESHSCKQQQKWYLSILHKITLEDIFQMFSAHSLYSSLDCEDRHQVSFFPQTYSMYQPESQWAYCDSLPIEIIKLISNVLSLTVDLPTKYVN